MPPMSAHADIRAIDGGFPVDGFSVTGFPVDGFSVIGFPVTGFAANVFFRYKIFATGFQVIFRQH